MAPRGRERMRHSSAFVRCSIAEVPVIRERGHSVGRGSTDELDLFPAVPAPVAVLCGRETLPKIHPALRVYDYDKTQGGFTYQLTVNS